MTSIATAASPPRTATDAAGPVRITEVRRLGPSEEVVCGFSIDRPKPDQVEDTYAFTLRGWVLSRSSPPVAIEMRTGPLQPVRIALNVRRPDIAALNPDVDWAANTGFQVGLNAVRLPSRFEIHVDAVLRDETKVPLAVIRGERDLPAIDTRHFLQPVVLTTLGRTGSTWVTRLLGCHPSVLAFRPFEYEARLCSYWLEIAGVLTDPASFAQALRGDLSGEHWWAGRRLEGPEPTRPLDSDVEGWLGRRHAQELVPFAVRQIEAFYRQVIESADESDATHFVEKYSPNSFVPDLLRDLYPGSREILLVRDFRDMVCSILAYNRKRGYQGFGRDRVESDADYIGQLRAGSVDRMLARWEHRSDTLCLLRYEDLVTDPVPTLERVFREIGVGPEAAAATLERARALTPDAQKQHSTSADAAASIGRWRRDLDPALRDLANAEFGDALDRFGYEV